MAAKGAVPPVMTCTLKVSLHVAVALLGVSTTEKEASPVAR